MAGEEQQQEVVEVVVVVVGDGGCRAGLWGRGH
jgi:hypothetical protein